MGGLRLNGVYGVLGIVALTLVLGLAARACRADVTLVPVDLGFDSHNGEIGSLPAEVIVDGGPPLRVTTVCEAREAQQPSVCRSDLTLPPGPHTFSVRVQTPWGWTPWSEVVPAVVKRR
jgi:hypothetical protein